MSRQSQSKKKLAESAVDRPIMDETEPLRLDDSMAGAGAKLCRIYVGVLPANAQGAAKGKDTEYVHQIRVAVRKLRFILQLLTPHLEKKETARLNEDLKWFAGALGRVRDADILLLRFETQWESVLFSQPFKDFIRQELAMQGAAAQKALIDVLSSERYERLTASLERLFKRKFLRGEEPPLKSIVPELFAVAVKKASRFTNGKLENNEIHSFRIAFKRLRYIAEFFNDIYSGKLSGHLRKFKKFQDILGSYCDAQVAESFLTALSDGGAKRTAAAQKHSLELGGLILLQRLEAAKQYRRFKKKAASLSERLRFLLYRTKQI